MCDPLKAEMCCVHLTTSAIHLFQPCPLFAPSAIHLRVLHTAPGRCGAGRTRTHVVPVWTPAPTTVMRRLTDRLRSRPKEVERREKEAQSTPCTARVGTTCSITARASTFWPRERESAGVIYRRETRVQASPGRGTPPPRQIRDGFLSEPR